MPEYEFREKVLRQLERIERRQSLLEDAFFEQFKVSEEDIQ